MQLYGTIVQFTLIFTYSLLLILLVYLKWVIWMSRLRNSHVFQTNTEKALTLSIAESLDEQCSFLVFN